MFTLAHFKKFNKNIAIINEKNIKYTYSNIIKEIKYFKNKIALSDEKIAILISNNFFSFIIIYLACVIYKTKLIIVNENHFQNNYIKIINNFKPDFIFSSMNFSKIKFFKNKIKFKYKNYFIYYLNKNNKLKINKEIAILLPTSGSTGSPKFACLSYENLITNTKSIISYLKINKSSTTITSLNPGYSYGLSIINSHLYKGSKLVMNSYSILDLNFWKLFKVNKIKFFYTVPLMCEILFKDSSFSNSFKYLNTLCCAGGHLDKKIKLNILSFLKNKNIFVMYGQTEASPRISYVNISKNKNKIDSIGKSVKGGELFFKSNKNKISMKKLPKEIYYKGKNVMLFYAEKIKDLAKKRSNNYIINTGDLGYQDSQNFFYLTGRKNRIAKINGVRIDLDQIDKDFKSQKITSINIQNKVFLCSKKVIKKNSLNKISKIYNLGINNIKTFRIRTLPLNYNNKLDYSKLTKIIKNEQR